MSVTGVSALLAQGQDQIYHLVQGILLSPVLSPLRLMAITDEERPWCNADATQPSTIGQRGLSRRTCGAGGTAIGGFVLAGLARITRATVGSRVALVANAITGIEEAERKLRRAVVRARGIIGILRLQAVHSVVAAGRHGSPHVLEDCFRRRIKIKIIKDHPEHSIPVIGCGIHIVVVGEHGAEGLCKVAA